MQSSFKEHFQLIVFQMLWDWRLEKSCMRNHTCLFDHHQTSHYDTIGPEGKFNWVLQLINSQLVRLFDSLEEKFNTKRSPNQPNQSQNQSVIDQENLRTRKVWLSSKVKPPVPMRSMKKVFTKNCVFWMEQGNVRSRLAWLKLVICLQIPVLSKLTMDQGNLMSVTAQVHTQWKNNLLLTNIVKFRQTTRTTSSIVQSTRRTLTSTFQAYRILQWTITWRQRSRLDSENREPPESARSFFNETYNKVNHSITSAKNQSKWFWCWERRIVWITRYGTQSTVQSMFIILGRRYRLLHMRALPCETERRRTRNLSSTPWSSSRFLITT